MAAKKRGLGRGLDALLGSTGSEAGVEGRSGADSRELREIPIDMIRRGKYQPRRDMDQDALGELAASIKLQGVMQPIVLRPVGHERYEIIAGERRWRATQMAGLDTIPALIRDVPDEAAIAMSLIENIQRENLNPIEEAMALLRLQQEFELTQQQVADAVGKNRSTITNLMRLMSLREDVRAMLAHGELETGHGKALLGLPPEEQSAAAKTVVSRGLSVRQTEALVRRLLDDRGKPSSRKQPLDPDVRRLQDDLAERLGARVEIRHSGTGKGKLVLSYSSLEELDGILSHIK